MVGAIVMTLLVVPAVLLLLVVAASTQCYTARLPSGPDVMGLALPFFMSAIGAAALFVATWIGLARGGLDWISARPLVPSATATLIAIGVGVAAVGMLIAWMERMGSWVPIAGALCGVIGPVVLGAVLLVCAWGRREVLADSNAIRVVGGLLVLPALCGLLMAGIGIQKHLKRAAENQRRAIESIRSDEAARAHHRGARASG